MNVFLLPPVVKEAATWIGSRIKYPWPTGIFVHASFLASFICYAPPYALPSFRSVASASHWHGFLDCRTYEIERVMAVLIHTMYGNGVELSDIKTILLYALILLLRCRECQPERRPLVGTDPTVWITAAVRIACTNYMDVELYGWQDFLKRPSIRLRFAELFIMKTSLWKTWVKDEDIEQFQQMIEAAGWFGGGYFDDQLPR